MLEIYFYNLPFLTILPYQPLYNISKNGNFLQLFDKWPLIKSIPMKRHVLIIPNYNLIDTIRIRDKYFNPKINCAVRIARWLTDAQLQ